MSSIISSITYEHADVDRALAHIGLSREVVTNVANAAAAARADSLPVDPACAPGMLSYIYGVRAIRMNLLKEGWKESRYGNVESTVNDALGVQLLFQNVDMACDDSCSPRAISGKGAVTRQIVSAGQRDLFEPDAIGDRMYGHFGATPVVWVICVSADDRSIRAEVSCPKIFEGTQFEDFHQRIFVLNASLDDGVIHNDVVTDDIDDFDVEISRKQ